eukprot:5044484-Prymnesium_polylepis.1
MSHALVVIRRAAAAAAFISVSANRHRVPTASASLVRLLTLLLGTHGALLRDSCAAARARYTSGVWAGIGCVTVPTRTAPLPVAMPAGIGCWGRDEGAEEVHRVARAACAPADCATHLRVLLAPRPPGVPPAAAPQTPPPPPLPVNGVRPEGSHEERPRQRRVGALGRGRRPRVFCRAPPRRAPAGRVAARAPRWRRRRQPLWSPSPAGSGCRPRPALARTRAPFRESGTDYCGRLVRAYRPFPWDDVQVRVDAAKLLLQRRS